MPLIALLKHEAILGNFHLNALDILGAPQINTFTGASFDKAMGK